MSVETITVMMLKAHPEVPTSFADLALQIGKLPTQGLAKLSESGLSAE